MASQSSNVHDGLMRRWFHILVPLRMVLPCTKDGFIVWQQGQRIHSLLLTVSIPCGEDILGNSHTEQPSLSCIHYNEWLVFSQPLFLLLLSSGIYDRQHLRVTKFLSFGWLVLLQTANKRASWWNILVINVSFLALLFQWIHSQTFQHFPFLCHKDEHNQLKMGNSHRLFPYKLRIFTSTLNSPSHLCILTALQFRTNTHTPLKSVDDYSNYSITQGLC